MITANAIRQYAYLDALTLERLIQKNYPCDRVLLSDFIGINSDYQFVYSIYYPDPLCGGLSVAMVYVWQNGSGEMVADYS